MIFIRHQVFRSGGYGLDARLFVIGKYMDDLPILREGYKLPAFIELHGELFVYEEHIVHLLVEFRITPFAIISDLVRLYISLLEDRAHLRLADCRQSHMPGTLCKLIYVLCEKRSCPSLGGITKVHWLLAGDTDDPGLFVIGYLGVSPAARRIEKRVLDTAFKILIDTEHYALTVHSNFIGYFIDRHTFSLKKEDAGELLRQLVTLDDPAMKNVVYVLAVMLERSKILVERDAKELEDGKIRRVYEDRKQGDTFVILDPRLRLENLAEVQGQVVALLSGTKTLGEVAKEEDCAAESQPQQ